MTKSWALKLQVPEDVARERFASVAKASELNRQYQPLEQPSYRVAWRAPGTRRGSHRPAGPQHS